MDIHYLIMMLEIFILRSLKNPASIAKYKPYLLDLYLALKQAFAGDPDFN